MSYLVYGVYRWNEASWNFMKLFSRQSQILALQKSRSTPIVLLPIYENAISRWASWSYIHLTQNGLQESTNIPRGRPFYVRSLISSTLYSSFPTYYYDTYEPWTELGFIFINTPYLSVWSYSMLFDSEFQASLSDILNNQNLNKLLYRMTLQNKSRFYQIYKL